MVNYLFEFPYSPVMFLQIYKFCRLSFASSVFSKVDSWCTLFYFDETGCAELLCNILIINTFKDFLGNSYPIDKRPLSVVPQTVKALILDFVSKLLQSLRFIFPQSLYNHCFVGLVCNICLLLYADVICHFNVNSSM